ncbi:MAG: hypothetical protein K6F37_00275 [Lachnospiraceae bacterium]|nr:hypothetical protein [Lachnospiraceae bacterium]
MKRRMLILALIVWIVAILCIMQGVLLSMDSSERKGAYLGGCSSDEVSYVIDQRSNGSSAYKFTENKLDVLTSAETLGLSAFEYIGTWKEGPMIVAATGGYHVLVLFDANLNPMKQSSAFSLPEDTRVSSASEEAGEFYIGVVEEDGSGAYIFSIESSVIHEFSNENEETETPKQIFEKKSTDGSIYLEAVYRGGVLNIWTDKEAPGEYFKIDETAKNAYLSASIGFINRMHAFPTVTTVFLVLLATGAIAILALIILCNRHPFISVAILCICGMAVLLSLTGVPGHLRGLRETEQATLSFMDGYLDALKDKVADELTLDDNYDSLKTSLSGSLWDTLVIDGNLETVASKRGRNNMSCEDLYGSEFEKLCMKAVSDKSAHGVIRYRGERYAVSVISMKEGDNQVPYVLAGLYKLEEINIWDMLRVWLFLGVALLIFAIIFSVKSFFEYRALHQLSDTMGEVSKGSGEEVVIPENKPYRIAKHWEALGEIAMAFRRMNYTAYQVYEAYFRFAPKKIETILDKTSIAEVEVGDVAEFNGTEAILSVADEQMRMLDNISDMNRLLSIMEKHQEKSGGVLVSSDMSVGLVKIVFKEKEQVLPFGIDFCHEESNVWPGSPRAGVVLHFGQFRYGVAGTSLQSIAFLYSEESALLEKYSMWLRKLGLCLCITESVKRHEGISDGLRYVGYIREGEIKLDLYEVLAANPVSIRNGKKENLEKYSKAMESFKSSNFYLARNLFSEILKEVPKDALVKWYLFESERLLNQGPAEELLRLHMD